MKCDGSTFGRTTYPDLYRALGNSNKLPDLRRSNVGMTAYFATDKIPEGWIAFDEIKEKVKEDTYPELYKYLIEKYTSIDNVPKAEDRFLRNAHGELTVGMTQLGSLIGTDSIDGNGAFSPYVKAIQSTYQETVDQVGFDPLLKEEIGNGRGVVNNERSPDGGQPETKKQYNAGLSWSVGTGKNEDLNDPIKNNDTGNGHFIGVTRPKSLVLKLCIKAKSSFDEVVFWIKAFGAVENQGVLDASAIVQEMQDFKRQAEEKIQSITLQKEEIMHAIQEEMGKSDYSLVKVWEGKNIYTEGSINLSEPCFGSTVFLFAYADRDYPRELVVFSFDVPDKHIDLKRKNSDQYTFYGIAHYTRSGGHDASLTHAKININRKTGDQIKFEDFYAGYNIYLREIYIKKPNNRKAR